MNFGGVSAFQKKPQGVDKQAPTIDMRMKQPFSNEQLPKSDILEELKKFNMPQELLERQDPFLANSNPNPNQAESQQPTAPERKPSRADFYKEKGPMGLGGMEGLGGLGDMGALG